MTGTGYYAGTIYGPAFHGLTIPLGTMQPGATQAKADGGIRMLVQYDPNAVGNLVANAAVKLGGAGFVVKSADTDHDVVLGVNDLSGDGLTTGHALVPGEFFWATVHGYCFPLLDAAVAAQTQVSAQASAAGTLSAVDGSADEQVNIVSQAASGLGGATLCYIL